MLVKGKQCSSEPRQSFFFFAFLKRKTIYSRCNDHDENLHKEGWSASELSDEELNWSKKRICIVKPLSGIACIV